MGSIPGPLPVLAVLSFVACGTLDEPIAVPLIDLFDTAIVTGTVPIDPIKRTEWRFNGEGTVGLANEPEGDSQHDMFGWEAYNNVVDLAVRDGHLIGTTGKLSLLHATRPDTLDENDLLHSVEIALQVSQGTRIGVTFDGAEELNRNSLMARIRRAVEPPLSAELIPGDDVRTYTLRNVGQSFPISRLRHILIEPSDVEGAEFEIESIRLVPLKEHLRSIASGPGWHGLGEIYRETIVSRSPERIMFNLDLPSRPWLDLSVGTIEDAPVTFIVSVDTSSGTTQLWRRTVTTPRRWETRRIDLTSFVGQSVTLSLSLETGDAGALGFWGAPVIRSSDASPNRNQESLTSARAALADNGARIPQGVVVVLVDTLRNDHLEAYGYHRETAPFLSKLTTEGVRFSNAISQGTWTKVSVPTLLSSIYPPAHGIVGTTDRLPSGATTLAEAYRSAGYATFHTSSVPFTGKMTNLHQGVEVLHERASINDDDLGHSRAKTARIYADRFLVWLDEHYDVPFYAFIHVFDPHDPYEPYPPYDVMWASQSGKEEHEARLKQVKDVFGDDLRRGDGNRFPANRFPNVSELEKAGVASKRYNDHLLDWYDGSIRGMDAELSRLFEGLRERGVADDTLVAFVSDHGEEFFEHGWGWHGNTVYGEMVNVPMVLWWPGVIPNGLVIKEVVESISLMPTLLELSQLRVPDDAQGQSLIPLLAETDDPSSLGWEERPAFSERIRIPSRADRKPFDVDQRSVVLDDWKLVHNVDPPEDVAEYELYSHADDPLNLVNIAADHPNVVDRLKGELADRLRYMEARKLQTDEDAAEGLSPDELQRLRSLGYLR